MSKYSIEAFINETKENPQQRIILSWKPSTFWKLILIIRQFGQKEEAW
jgi:hypothetical protein